MNRVSQNVMSFYTDDSPGIKIPPVSIIFAQCQHSKKNASIGHAMDQSFRDVAFDSRANFPQANGIRSILTWSKKERVQMLSLEMES